MPRPAPLRVLVAGCGYVGSVLAAELAAEGHTVFGLRRRPVGLPVGVTPVAADLADPTTLGALPRDLAAVVYTASANGFSDGAYRAAYVDGPRHLLAALAAARERPRHVLFASSTAVYGQSDGAWVDETSETRPPGFSGAHLLEGEAVVLGGAWPGTVLRLGGIYGPGRARLVERVRRGEARAREGPPLYTNRIHRDDAAGALRHLLGLAAPERIYLGVDMDPADEREVLGFVARALGVPEPAPAGAEPRVAGPSRATEPSLEASAVGERSARPRGSKRCSSARLVASGYRFRFPTFREGYADLIRRLDVAG